MKGSIIILLFFSAGILIGFYFDLPDFLLSEELTLYALYILIFLVGLSVGHDKKVYESFKKQDYRVLLLPIGTITGTLIGSLAISFMLSHRNVYECLAVGSGFGYYSLSSVIITQYKGAELGTIALIANIIREIITLVGAPLLVYIFGRLAPISAGGATTADTTLPIITKFSGKEFIVLSIVHGITVDLTVPFLVTFFAGL